MQPTSKQIAILLLLGAIAVSCSKPAAPAPVKEPEAQSRTEFNLAGAWRTSRYRRRTHSSRSWRGTTRQRDPAADGCGHTWRNRDVDLLEHDRHTAAIYALRASSCCGHASSVAGRRRNSRSRIVVKLVRLREPLSHNRTCRQGNGYGQHRSPDRHPPLEN